MAAPARSLFEQFREGGYERIVRAITSNESETAHLDFKENRTREGPQSTLTSSGREKLGLAISAFANVGGGILVWGIEAKDKKANADAAIPDIATFVQSLYTHTGGIVNSSVTGIEHTTILKPGGHGNGYAVTYIPESNEKPHQCVATAGTTNYWMRISQT